MIRICGVLAVAIGVVGLAACTADPPTSAQSDRAPIQSGGAQPPSETIGEINVREAGVADGPGVSIAEAIAADAHEPLLVNGILFQDADGVIWLCSALLESSPPGCAEPKLKALNFPSEVGDLDPANADVTGLQQDGDVRWIEDYQLFGVAEPGL
ncbi:MAG: hypothetical protein ACRDGH_05605 [Candidatus Limnocylindria bacterium]